jgi:hypothetical protein
LPSPPASSTPLSRSKSEHDLTHLDPVAVLERHRALLALVCPERPPVHHHRVRRRQILEPPLGGARRRVRAIPRDDLQRHSRMCAAYRWLTELDVTIGRSLRAPECHSCAIRARCANEPNLMAGVATGHHLESARQELQCPIRRSPVPHRRALDSVTSHGIVRLRGVRERCGTGRVRRDVPGWWATAWRRRI